MSRIAPEPRPLALLALTLLLTACSPRPDYETLGGDSGRFEDLRGRWVFVNYWAEWCKPCLQELPALKAFQDKFPQQVTVLTVNFDNPEPAVLHAQAQKLDIRLPVLLRDPGQQLGIARPLGLPTTYVFNPQGQLAAQLNGEQTVESLAAAMQAAPTP